MMGRPASGRARKASISLPRSATTSRPLKFCLGVLPRNLVRALRPSSGYGVRSRTGGSLGFRGCGRREEIRRQPGLDVVGDLLGGAILGIADGARAGKALVAAWDVVGEV